ncbi:Ig-like domain-containing protein, partial [Acinetobacter baumannii]
IDADATAVEARLFKGTTQVASQVLGKQNLGSQGADSWSGRITAPANLAEGTDYTIKVVVTDRAGNSKTVASPALTIDLY